jgi:HEAT repeat protein
MTAKWITRQVEQAFAQANEETFDDGAESNFERVLVRLVHVGGNEAVKAIERVLEAPTTPTEIAGEVLRRLGAMTDGRSKKYRMSILQRYLASPSSRLRYAAAVGLAAMDDATTISAIVEAMQTESNRDILRTLEQVLEQLQATERCRGT